MKNFNKANIYWEWGLFPVALLLELDKKEKAMQMATTLMIRAGLASNYHPEKQVALSSMPVCENLFNYAITWPGLSSGFLTSYYHLFSVLISTGIQGNDINTILQLIGIC